MVRLRTPDLVGGRAAAREMLSTVPSDLARARVVVDCGDLLSTSPSFVDEVVKVVLADRRAAKLKLKNAPAQVAAWAQESAMDREVADRLMVDVRPR